MAIKVISLTSKGRGYTLPLETCLMDNRFPDLKLLRPLKDILSKEIGIFNYYKNIEPIIIPTFTTKAVNPKTSIDHLTEGNFFFKKKNLFIFLMTHTILLISFFFHFNNSFCNWTSKRFSFNCWSYH